MGGALLVFPQKKVLKSDFFLTLLEKKNSKNLLIRGRQFFVRLFRVLRVITF